MVRASQTRKSAKFPGFCGVFSRFLSFSLFFSLFRFFLEAFVAAGSLLKGVIIRDFPTFTRFYLNFRIIRVIPAICVSGSRDNNFSRIMENGLCGTGWKRVIGHGILYGGASF